ncbi:MAG TPA: polysaccharide biosynthesis protein, partial [Faecalibacterium sp.]|nr:polysaccharide biosynthesis protein [Faecalibacterium sp.]
AGFPAQGLPGQLAVLTAGGTVTAIVFLLAALPLGLWEEVWALLRQTKTGKNRGK